MFISFQIEQAAIDNVDLDLRSVLLFQRLLLELVALGLHFYIHIEVLQHFKVFFPSCLCILRPGMVVLADFLLDDAVQAFQRPGWIDDVGQAVDAPPVIPKPAPASAAVLGSLRPPGLS